MEHLHLNNLIKAHLIKSDLESMLLNRPVNMDRHSTIYLPTLTDELIRESGINDLFKGEITK